MSHTISSRLFRRSPLALRGPSQLVLPPPAGPQVPGEAPSSLGLSGFWGLWEAAWGQGDVNQVAGVSTRTFGPSPFLTFPQRVLIPLTPGSYAQPAQEVFSPSLQVSPCLCGHRVGLGTGSSKRQGSRSVNTCRGTVIGSGKGPPIPSTHCLPAPIFHPQAFLPNQSVWGYLDK